MKTKSKMTTSQSKFYSTKFTIAMLFALGFIFGLLAGYRPWVSGGSMVALGIVLVAITIALGG